MIFITLFLVAGSEGFVETIGNKKLMLMKAGKSFYHEETIDGESEPLEGLQIFIRPGRKDLNPEVAFYDLPELHSENSWRLLASPNPDTTFQFSSPTWLYDMKLLNGSSFQLPIFPKKNLTALLYVFRGSVYVNGTAELVKKDNMVIKEEAITITSKEDTELVLFMPDENAEIFKEGMYRAIKYDKEPAANKCIKSCRQI